MTTSSMYQPRTSLAPTAAPATAAQQANKTALTSMQQSRGTQPGVQQAPLRKGVADPSAANYPSYYDAFHKNLAAKKAGVAAPVGQEGLSSAFASQYGGRDILLGQTPPAEAQGWIQIPQGMNMFRGQEGKWIGPDHSNYADVLQAGGRGAAPTQPAIPQPTDIGRGMQPTQPMPAPSAGGQPIQPIPGYHWRHQRA